MKLPRWQQALLAPGYAVLRLFRSVVLRCDCHLIRVVAGAEIPEHLEALTPGGLPSPGHVLWKVHVLLATSGCTIYNGPECSGWWRFVLFRGDLVPFGHDAGATPTYILSFGWEAVAP